jgi:hypothetical protein
VTDPVSQQATQRNAESVGRVPQSDSDGLFPARIPHTRDEHEPGVRAGLRGTSEDSKDGEGGEAVACGLDHQEHAPVTIPLIRPLSLDIDCVKNSPHEDIDTKIFP